MHKNKLFILGILHNAVLAALAALHGAKYTGAIGTYGKQRKPASGLPAGL